MKKIGFVIPWFGFNIPGGAEAALKGLVLHLNKAGVELEILTTCVQQFQSDWNKNFHKPGLTIENDIAIRRFRVRKRDTAAFDTVNLKLMNNQIPLTEDEEKTFVNEMINSPDLYRYIRRHKDEYSLFVFIPYMFGTTFWGIQECYEKAVMIPCFHNESYIYMKCFQREFSKVAGMIFLAQPEQELAQQVFHLDHTRTAVLGAGVYTERTYDPLRFREKYQLKEPFLLYAGRKEVGKNINLLLRYFQKYKTRNQNDLKLVLIGGGEVHIPSGIQDQVIDLGFIDEQDKFDAYSAASILCQPSIHESFSLVVMESWICERPVLVHAQCNVTKWFATAANGGLYFSDYFEFEGTVNYILRNPDQADMMGRNGRKYVLEHFAWDVIVKNHMDFFRSLSPL